MRRTLTGGMHLEDDAQRAGGCFSAGRDSITLNITVGGGNDRTPSRPVPARSAANSRTIAQRLGPVRERFVARIDRSHSYDQGRSFLQMNIRNVLPVYGVPLTPTGLDTSRGSARLAHNAPPCEKRSAKISQRSANSRCERPGHISDWHLTDVTTDTSSTMANGAERPRRPAAPRLTQGVPRRSSRGPGARGCRA